MNSGWQTSEFWVSTMTSIFGMLVLMGKLTQTEADTLTKAITAAAGAVVTIASMLGYIITRIQLKQSVVEATADAASTVHPASTLNAMVQPTKESGMTGTAADVLQTALTKAGV